MNLGPFTFAVTALCIAGCGDLTSPGLTGRWAAEGIELRASTSRSELRFPCATVAPMSPVRVDSTGRFELFGRASHTYGSFDVMVQGQFVRGDTIHADVTILSQGAPPHTMPHVLVRDGDPGFEGFYCLGSAQFGAA
jgi:hypothetical protein